VLRETVGREAESHENTAKKTFMSDKRGGRKRGEGSAQRRSVVRCPEGQQERKAWQTTQKIPGAQCSVNFAGTIGTLLGGERVEEETQRQKSASLAT